MLDALRRHGAAYLMEAAGIAFFIAVSSVASTLLEYPGSPLHALIPIKAWRRVPLAIIIGLVIVGVTRVTGKRSGAHINPAVTWAFYRHGKITAWDAVGYTVAQVAGAVAAALGMRAVLGAPYAHPSVDYVVTKPGPGGPPMAFAAEFVISFILMLALLVATESRRLEKAAGWIAGALLAAYIVVETPLSGMSLNPARSFGSAIAAPASPALWVYVVAPTLAMWTAVEVYVRLRVASRIPDYQPGPTYPRTPPPPERPPDPGSGSVTRLTVRAGQP